jgi:hypothetical protein
MKKDMDNWRKDHILEETKVVKDSEKQKQKE